MTAFAQNHAGAEAPRLLDDMKQIAAKQADRLRSQPTTPQVVQKTQPASPTPSATAATRTP